MSENTNTTAPVSINDTILLALTEAGVSVHGYESVINSATKKLEEREQAMTAAVIEAADGLGYGYGGQAKTLLSEAGLSITPDPEPVVEEEAAAEAAEVPGLDVSALDGRLAKVEASIASLVALANRHLGASL